MFSFIILHYKNIDDTINCLNSIKKIDNNNYNIIIVDNNSLKTNEIEILKKYTNDIIKLDNNYGFAKANNKGVEYAKNKYDSKYYIVINNDTIIDQNNFLDIIEKDYDKYHFDMMGPSITSPSNESVNPFPAFKTRESIEKEIKKVNKLIKIYSNSFTYILLRMYVKVKGIFVKKRKVTNGNKLETNVALHGCAIIFSKKYVERYEYPFFNDTFLFHEEEFLYQRVINDKLVSLYDPNLKIFHKEGSSINKSIKNARLSKLFREKERLKSLQLLLEQVK